jgi:hypothetical protein
VIFQNFIYYFLEADKIRRSQEFFLWQVLDENYFLIRILKNKTKQNKIKQNKTK